MVNVFEQPATLTTDDERVLDAYRSLGVPLDALVYTPEFKRLAREVGVSEDEHGLRQLWRHLLTLRKRGLLPRVYGSLASAQATEEG